MLGVPALRPLADRPDIGALPYGLGQRGQVQAHRARQGRVGREPSDRIAREERIHRDLDDLRLGPRRLERREPQHVRLDRHDAVGVVEVRRGVEAGMERVSLREVHVGVELVDHRRAEGLGELHECGDREGIAPGGLGEDDRVARGGQQPGRLGDRLRRGQHRAGSGGAARGGVLEDLVLLGEDLARQREVDGPLRLGLGERQRTVDDRLELGEVPELVVPFDELADHRALVEGLLRPVDRAVAAAVQAGLGERIASRAEEDRHVRARGVDDAADRVTGADDHVDHDDLRSPGDHRVAVGHPHRRRLVRDRHGPRHRLALREPPGVGVDERREVRPGIREEVLDAPSGQELEIGVSGAFDARSLGHRGLSPFSRAGAGLI